MSDTWCLVWREEQRLRVFENRVLWKIFGPKRDEGTEDWRRLLNEELHSLYPSPNIIRVMKSRSLRWADHVACMGERRGVLQSFGMEIWRKRTLARRRSRWKDNIKMDLE
jgi:hypothetical protein